MSFVYHWKTDYAVVDETVCVYSIPFLSHGVSIDYRAVLWWEYGPVSRDDTGIDPPTPGGEIGAVTSKVG